MADTAGTFGVNPSKVSQVLSTPLPLNVAEEWCCTVNREKATRIE
jgi:hypothetical protein